MRPLDCDQQQLDHHRGQVVTDAGRESVRRGGPGVYFLHNYKATDRLAALRQCHYRRQAIQPNTNERVSHRCCGGCGETSLLASNGALAATYDESLAATFITLTLTCTATTTTTQVNYG